MHRSCGYSVLIAFALLSLVVLHGQQQPRITLDEFFNFVDYSDVKISPDGKAVLISPGLLIPVRSISLKTTRSVAQCAFLRCFGERSETRRSLSILRRDLSSGFPQDR
jgi:hypothetical protein